MNAERLNELAVAFASGDINAAEKAELQQALATATAAERTVVAELVDTSAFLALRLPAQTPSPGLKEKILAQTRRQAPAIPLPSLHFLRNAAEKDWTPMNVPGAYFKLLFLNQERGYAVVLGKLDPGASYPAHTHKGPEQVLVLTGDLLIGSTALEAGDFHHADAGSKHDINRSVDGCTILLVITTEDLMGQLG